MSVLNFFKNITYSPEVKKYSQLYDQLAKEHPNVDEKNLVLASCISGLLARVAYVDFHLSEANRFIQSVKCSCRVRKHLKSCKDFT